MSVPQFCQTSLDMNGHLDLVDTAPTLLQLSAHPIMSQHASLRSHLPSGAVGAGNTTAETRSIEKARGCFKWTYGGIPKSKPTICHQFLVKLGIGVLVGALECELSIIVFFCTDCQWIDHIIHATLHDTSDWLMMLMPFGLI